MPATVRVLLALVVMCIALRVQPTAAIDLEGWRDALDTLAIELEGGLSPEVVAADLEALQGEPVTTADGEMRVDLTSVIALLRQAPPAVDAAVAALDSISAATGAPDADTDAATERAALDDVLARQEFTGQLPDDDPGLLTRASRWLDGQYARLLDWIGADSPSGSFVRLLLTLLAIAAILGALGVVIQAVRRRLAPGATTRNTLDLPPDTSAEDALREAERLAATGDYRQALRWRYVACLLRWQESGRLRLERSATNHEVLDEVRARGDLEGVRLLSPVVQQFERVWYGAAPCGEPEYRAFSVSSEPLWQHAGAGSAINAAPARTRSVPA